MGQGKGLKSNQRATNLVSGIMRAFRKFTTFEELALKTNLVALSITHRSQPAPILADTHRLFPSTSAQNCPKPDTSTCRNLLHQLENQRIANRHGLCRHNESPAICRHTAMKQNRLNIPSGRLFKDATLFLLPLGKGVGRVAACAAVLFFVQCTNTNDGRAVVEICKNCLPRKVRQSDNNAKIVESAICTCPASGHLPGCAAVDFFPGQERPGKRISH